MRMRLAYKLALLTLLVAGGAVVMLAWLASTNASRLLEQEALVRLKENVNQGSIAFERSFETVKGDLSLLKHTPALGGVIRAIQGGGYDDQLNETRTGWEHRLQEVFRTVMQQRSYYSQVRLIGLQEGGRELVRLDRVGGSIEVVPAERLQQKGQRPYLQQAAMLAEEAIYFSEVALNRGRGRIVVPWEPMLRLATPVFDPQSGAVFGVLVLNIHFDRFTRPLRQKVLEDSFYLLANGRGEYLIHPQSEKRFSFEIEEREESLLLDYPQMDLQAELEHWRERDELDHEHSSTRQLKGQGVGVTLRPFYFDPLHPERYLILGTVASSQVLEQQAAGFRQQLALLVLLVVIGVTIATALMVQWMTRPVRELTLAADRISQGDEVVRIDTSSGDEVGALARSFDTMLSHLQQSRRFAEQVITAAPVGMVVLQAGRIVVANPRFGELLGQWEVEDKVEHLLVAGQLAAEPLDLLLQGVRQRQPLEGVESAGGNKILSFTLVQMGQRGNAPEEQAVNENSKEQLWLLLVDDVTEARQAAQALQRVSTEVAYQSGMSEMSTSVLHNIGNAINSIGERTHQLDEERQDLLEVAGLLQQRVEQAKSVMQKQGVAETEVQEMLEMFERTPEILRELNSEGLQENISEIRTGVAHIADIVRVQQTLAKDGAGAGGSFSENFNLLDAVEDAHSLLSTSLQKRSIVFVPQVEVGEIRMPRNPFVQMLGNLLKNAMEAIDANAAVSGSGLIRLRAEVDPEDANLFVIRLIDNGCGIKLGRLASIFRFGETNKQQGSGFGLHSVANFVQSNGGSIAVESEGAGRGSTFVVRLPR